MFDVRENPLFDTVNSEAQCGSVSWPVPVGWSQYLSGMIFLRISEIQNTIFSFLQVPLSNRLL